MEPTRNSAQPVEQGSRVAKFGRTQSGNNNAYCQDNEISWFDWEGINRGIKR
jgi:pullulanase/glycogen debranching enzyme